MTKSNISGYSTWGRSLKAKRCLVECDIVIKCNGTELKQGETWAQMQRSDWYWNVAMTYAYISGLVHRGCSSVHWTEQVAEFLQVDLGCPVTIQLLTASSCKETTHLEETVNVTSMSRREGSMHCRSNLKNNNLNIFETSEHFWTFKLNKIISENISTLCLLLILAKFSLSFYNLVK